MTKTKVQKRISIRITDKHMNWKLSKRNCMQIVEILALNPMLTVYIDGKRIIRKRLNLQKLLEGEKL